MSIFQGPEHRQLLDALKSVTATQLNDASLERHQFGLKRYAAESMHIFLFSITNAQNPYARVRVDFDSDGNFVGIRWRGSDEETESTLLKLRELVKSLNPKSEMLPPIVVPTTQDPAHAS